MARKSQRIAAKKNAPPDTSRDSSASEESTEKTKASDDSSDSVEVVQPAEDNSTLDAPGVRNGNETQGSFTGMDFDLEVIYEDTYFKEDIDLDGTVKRMMDLELKQFLRDTLSCVKHDNRSVSTSQWNMLVPRLERTIRGQAQFH